MSTRSVDAHLATLLQSVSPLAAFPIGLSEARGCVAAADVQSAWPLPVFSTAAVDGYAVKLEDFTGELPVTLRVADVLPAGSVPDEDLAAGTAVRVSNGVVLPTGTDAVVAVADTDGGISEVVINRAPQSQANVVPAGRDVPEGGVVVTAGQLIDSQLIGLLAAAGRNSVVAHPHPRVVVMSVGDDLVDIGAQLRPGQSVDANGPMVAARAAESGASVYRVGPVSEDQVTLVRTLEDQLVRADLIVITLGQSDRTPESLISALQQLGSGELTQLLMQPGSLHGFGLIGEESIPVIVLPAQPLAAFVAFEVLVRPVLRRLRGMTESSKLQSVARMHSSLSVPAGLRNYLCAEYVEADDGLQVRPLAAQDAHLVGGLATADCIVVVPDLVVNLESGDLVDIIPLRERKP